MKIKRQKFNFKLPAFSPEVFLALMLLFTLAGCSAKKSSESSSYDSGFAEASYDGSGFDSSYTDSELSPAKSVSASAPSVAAAPFSETASGETTVPRAAKAR